MKYIWKKFPEEIIKGGIVAGMVGGYLYWRYVGCTTGTCPITSSPVNSSIWGAAMGGLLLSSFMPEHKKIKKEE